MLFNSIEFAVFLPIVFLAYWCLPFKSLKTQNLFIAFVSYVFYGWWDWRFLFLILFSTIVDFVVGRRLSQESQPTNRKLLLWVSIIVNIGSLGFFKYCNFFIENFVSAFTFLGTSLEAPSLQIILPVGISFYTFQTLSYTIDVYRQKLKPTQDFVSFMAFVSFFPQLVAGPIERASNLLPQFYSKRLFNYSKSVDGLRQILWGLFKKVVIADSCAEYANYVFNNSDNMGGSGLILGAVLFSFQIYGDFSGYSDIAIGTSRLFGFDLLKNFSFPYFSRDIGEFWRRWHISLSTWFRDYLYIPLGGSRGGKWMKTRNTFAIFIVSGFWHGANWTFIIWGLLNAIYFLPLLLRNKNRQNIDVVAQNRLYPSPKELVQMLSTFGLTSCAWIFFRAKDLNHAISFIMGIFSNPFFDFPRFPHMKGLLILFALVPLFIVIEWFGRKDEYAIETIALKSSKFLRLGLYFILAVTVLLFSGTKQSFIYFQF